MTFNWFVQQIRTLSYQKMRKDLGDYFDGFFAAVKREEPLAEFKTAAQLIVEFGQYVDMLSAANPQRLHHVYEWGQVGSQEGRLFELSATPTAQGVIITYEFRDSMVPNDSGVVFAKKAEVMESGESVTTTPTRPVPMDGGESFRVGSFTFVPGGPETSGAFRETFMLYFANRANLIRATNQTLRPSSVTRSGGYADGKRVYDSIIGK